MIDIGNYKNNQSMKTKSEEIKTKVLSQLTESYLYELQIIY